MKPRYAAFAALDPFFEVVQRGLSGRVDGKHYFDTIAENAIFEFRYDIAGWPKRIESRGDLIDLYRAYGDSIVLERGDGLVVHRCDGGTILMLEYQVHGCAGDSDVGDRDVAPFWLATDDRRGPEKTAPARGSIGG